MKGYRVLPIAALYSSRFFPLQSFRRKPQLEFLEARQLCVSDWHNAVLPCDADGSALVTPLDALVVINAINRDGSRLLPVSRDVDAFHVDVNNDGYLSPLDALVVINAINRNPTELAIALGSSPSSDPNSNGVVLGESISFVGQTGVSAKIVLTWPEGSSNQPIATTADANGQFQMVVPVGNGVHRVRLTATDELGRTIQSTQEIRKGDIIADWNAAALNVVRGWTTTSNDPYQGRIVPSQPPMVARNLAMIQTAMFDAINAVNGAYRGYAFDIAPQTGASAIAAAASAAYDVASSIYPDAKERDLGRILNRIAGGGPQWRG